MLSRQVLHIGSYLRDESSDRAVRCSASLYCCGRVRALGASCATGVLLR